MKPGVNIPVRSRNGIVIDSDIDYVRIKMHDANSANTVAWSARIAGTELSDTAALAGTTEAFSSADPGLGIFNPGLGLGSADNYVVLPSSLNSIFDPSLLVGEAVLIFLVSFKYGANVPQEYLLAVNRSIAATPGGYGLNTQNSQFQLNTRAIGASAAVQSKVSSLATTVWHSGAAMIDGINGTQHTAADGSWASGETVQLFANGGSNFTGMTAAFGGATIGAAIGTGPAYTVLMNDAVNDDLEAHSYWVLKLQAKPSESWLASLFLDYHKTPREIMPALALVVY